MTNAELLEEVNSRRHDKVKLGGMLHQCRRMGLCRGVQIRWSDEDVKYLGKMYHKYGDTELAEKLTKRKKTFRVIDGKKSYRVFTKKHICKKRSLLGLVRTPKEIRAIRVRNVSLGKMKDFTPEDNLWTRGVKIAIKEGDTVIQKRPNGYRMRMIKIEGKLIPYTRWFYKNYVGPVADNDRVMHIDLDPINDDPSNLRVVPRRATLHSEREEAVRLLNLRIDNSLKYLDSLQGLKLRAEEPEIQKEITRLRNIIRHLEYLINRNKK